MRFRRLGRFDPVFQNLDLWRLQSHLQKAMGTAAQVAWARQSGGASLRVSSFIHKLCMQVAPCDAFVTRENSRRSVKED